MKTLNVFLFILLFACLAVSSDIVSYPFDGITHIQRTLTSPRPLNINIIRVDLDADGIGFVVTPNNGSASGDANPATCTTFLEDTGSQIAINCGFYNMNTNDVLGFVASAGDVYSDFVDYNQWEFWPTPYVSLNISMDNIPQMITPGASLPTYTTNPQLNPWNAVAGSEWIVYNGVNVVDNRFSVNPGLNPRTVGGYTQDKTELILVTIDGRQTGFSEGMTTSEAADFLISLGAYQGINFDGGGSTTMAFADPNPRVVNSPSGGVQRSVANHLGIYTNGAPPIDKILQPGAYISFDEEEFGGAVYIDDQLGTNLSGTETKPIAGSIDMTEGGAVGRYGEFVNNGWWKRGGDSLAVPHPGANGTIAMWARLNISAVRQNYPLLWDANPGNNSQGWKVYTSFSNNNQQESFTLYNRIDSNIWTASSVTIDAKEQWFHYAFTWKLNDVGTHLDTVLYINGYAVSYKTEFYDSHDSVIRLGGGGESLEHCKWQGDMDEIYIFDTALRSDMVNYLANQSYKIPFNPRPYVGFEAANIRSYLSWDLAEGLTDPKFNVYLSNSVENLNQALAASGCEDKFFIPTSNLTPEEIYYWRIDVDDSGEIYQGPIWNFTPALNQADITADGFVNLDDFAVIAGYWGNSDDSSADINKDGIVDIEDLLMFTSYWFDGL